MADGPYKWSEFKAEVKKLTPVDTLRAASSAAASDYYDRVLRHAVMDLQRHIPGYTIGHEAIYHPSDFAEEGSASRGVLPPESTLRDIFVVRINDEEDDGGAGTTNRHPTITIPWAHRFRLVYGMEAVNDDMARVAIDPQGYIFYVYPKIEEPYVVSVNYDGRRLEYKEDEYVAFDEQATLAVAEYIRAMHARDVEKNVSLSKSYMESYERQRLMLHIDKKGSTK